MNCKPATQKAVALPESGTWQRIGPGGGGSTFIPRFSYHTPDMFMVRCDMTGSYLTKDGGNSYQLINIAGGTSCYAFDPVDSNSIYLGSAVLHRSADGGKSWTQIFPKKSEVTSEIYIGDHAEYEITTENTSLYVKEPEKISTIRVDPSKSGSLYFSMGNYFFYSTNAGDSWSKENLGYHIDYLYTNTGAAKNDLYIFTQEKVFIFNKDSKRITAREIPVSMSPAYSFTAGTLKNSSATMLYALHHDFKKQNPWDFGHSEVWSSKDLGLTWEKNNDTVITNGYLGISPSLSMINCSEFDAANAYVVTNRYQEKLLSDKLIDWYGALKTSDAGKSWHWVWKGGGGSGQYGVQDATDAPNLNDAWVHKAFGGEFIQLFDAGVSPRDGNIAIVTDWYRTMKTMDGGITWQEIYSHMNPDTTYTSRGMDVTTTYGVHFDPYDSSHLAISYTDIGYHHSYDGGKSWKRSAAGVPSDWVNTCYWVVFDPGVKNKVWSVWSGLHDFPRGKMTRNPQWKDKGRGGVCVSTDGGRTWKPTVEGMGMNSPATSIVLDPKSAISRRTLYAAVYNKGVFKSIDDGKTWQIKNKGIDSNTCAFELTLASNGNLYLTVSPTPAHKDGKKGPAFYSGAVYRSTDGAETWTKLTISKGLLFPNGMEIDPDDPKRIYLACWAAISLSDLVGGDVVREAGGNKLLDMPGGIFLSVDGGDSWTSIFDQKQYVYDVTADPHHPGRLYCNTYNKVAWRSDDRGKSWKKLRDYDFHWGHRVIVDQYNPEKVFITTYGSSVWHGVPATE
ncbi:sialidase family protein [Flavihumibacter fluvii]|uniref:sialidase family protein n=1 Tax=Flavihumibacter fluvii TaxID=2838157 RepID=UPI001BDE30EF|nr:sialidase family protein [Flavihumibacter fluvii]ULQ54609.1 hypothetical protein KJS93_09785 [Flavihumibacter fluvii]